MVLMSCIIILKPFDVNINNKSFFLYEKLKLISLKIKHVLECYLMFITTPKAISWALILSYSTLTEFIIVIF